MSSLPLSSTKSPHARALYYFGKYKEFMSFYYVNHNPKILQAAQSYFTLYTIALHLRTPTLHKSTALPPLILRIPTKNLLKTPESGTDSEPISRKQRKQQKQSTISV